MPGALELLGAAVTGLGFDELRDRIDAEPDDTLREAVLELQAQIAQDVDAARRRLVEQPALAMALKLMSPEEMAALPAEQRAQVEALLRAQ
ncbi:hypothetical protein EMIHUDRAFT_213620 [Emiliania huxleyi CCMP1516]|uniref:Uncharacterized protein n=2 Tax=Emiliania huxleyi TaxID=2903 RepID=A0A0D3IMA5_EMIH1|nr:hypothetical protein EMIHUDRAFT_213620 [Emiliania huxleyi CCMP1516]EOD12390.1 hypothetical protein EMIHUDRAFT_213620 [Emiliania huxleyi CCMP1516]|eukprot:XP_005764819.1 hypothetical protein EMIHUDRAFT_213620 [Emiliania huxleyi CCMP1516]